MDPIKKEKHQAMNKYKKNQFHIINLILYSSIALSCFLFCSTPFWFPSLYSSMKLFLFVHLPNIRALIFNPKCLFIVCNIIVAFLVGESKLVGSKPSAATEIYEDYVKRSTVRSTDNHQRLFPTFEEKKEKERGEDLGGEEHGLAAEELNKRADDFIARVNKQRKLEARSLVRCTA